MTAWDGRGGAAMGWIVRADGGVWGGAIGAEMDEAASRGTDSVPVSEAGSFH